MSEVIESLFCSFIIALTITYASAKLADKKLKFNNYKLFIILVIETIYLSISYYITDNIIRVIFNYFCLTLVNKLFLKKDICESNIIAFFTIIIFLIAENICAFLMVIILKIKLTQISSWYVNIAINFIIASLVILIVSNKVIFNLIKSQINKVNMSLNKSLMILLAVTLITLLILMYSIYYQFIPIITLLLNIIIIIFYIVITITIFKEKSEKEQLQSEYNVTLKNLNDYEKMLDIQRMKNHENDNNLSAIRGMIDPKNKEAINYIDSLVIKIKSNDKDIALKVKKIPSGGLQGLIYQKMLLMEQKKYHYYLEVSKEVERIKLNKMNSQNIKDLCTIVGVLLDNAIQAVQEYRKKLVGIQFYRENNYLIITISNNFKGNLELEKFCEKGYTTKDEGHGYGLSLVKEILDRNKNIINEKTFNGNIFSQILKIQVK